MAINIRFKAIVDTLANIATDKFQGRLAWATNIARMIWYYDANNYGEMARRDVLETFAGGIQDSTLANGQALVAGASGRLQSQDAATFRGTVGAAATSHQHAQSDVSRLNEQIISTKAITIPVGGTSNAVYSKASFLAQKGGDYSSGNTQTNGVGFLNNGINAALLFYNPDAALAELRYVRDIAGPIVRLWDSGNFSPTAHNHQSVIVDGIQRISTAGTAAFSSVQASNLSGSGTRPLVADASGNIDDQDAATFRATIGVQSVGRRLWAEKNKAQSYANNERSILGATAAQRKVAANTISDGTVIRLVAVGRFQASSSGSTLRVKFTCGPDGDYFDPYCSSSYGIPCAALTSASGYKVEALLYFVGSGASAGVYVELTIQFFGADGVVTTYRNASLPGSPLAVDGSIDRYLDIVFQVSGGTSSYSTITPTHSFAEIVTP